MMTALIPATRRGRTVAAATSAALALAALYQWRAEAARRAEKAAR